MTNLREVTRAGFTLIALLVWTFHDDLPASSHGGARTFSFADGHAEV